METETGLRSHEETLRNCSLLRGLSDSELEKLFPFCREEIHEAGALISRQGDPSHTIRIVESGKVALQVDLHISRSMEESATIDVVTRGGTLCLSALIEPHILTGSVTCLEPTRLIAIEEADLKPLFDENPRVAYQVMSNLAEIVRLRLIRTEETTGRILSIIFHDLKTPLAAAESYNRLLLGGFTGELNEEQKTIVQRSSKRLSDLLNLVSNMIDLSRVDFGELRIGRVCLPKVIKDCVEAMQPLVEEKGLKLINEVPEKLPTILGAPERLKQVFTNLLSNAVKFTPAGGTVTVTAKDSGMRIQVEVADTGIGIPAEELPKIFDGFYRGLNVSEKGAGLGLSIAKRIVESHHGKVWAVSPCPETGKGSKFICVLPKGSLP